jgi:hypothetical protein
MQAYGWGTSPKSQSTEQTPINSSFELSAVLPRKLSEPTSLLLYNSSVIMSACCCVGVEGGVSVRATVSTEGYSCLSSTRHQVLRDLTLPGVEGFAFPSEAS